MSKSSLPFDPTEYATVADRLTLFYKRHPTGRVITELVSRDRDIVFKASIYRTDIAALPAATGWASEREGDGEVNEVACMENTETSAIGRALANLGFTASIKRPSREEMQKAALARSRFYPPTEKPSQSDRVAERPHESMSRPSGNQQIKSSDQLASGRASEIMELVLEAGNKGMPPTFLRGLEQRIRDRVATTDELLEVERRARYWLLQRSKLTPDKTTQGTPITPVVNTQHQ